MKRVAIVTDSTACLPKELVEEYDIRVVPVAFIFEGRSYRDEIDITPSELYQLLETGDKLPTTSAPPPGAYLEAYRELSQRTDSIVCITVPRELSMVFQTAMQAKEVAREALPNTSISVIDCHTAAGGQGLIVLEAARAAAKGASLEEVLKVVKDMMPRVHLFVMLDTLYYLAKGGRIPKVVAGAGSVLRVKPFLTVADGKIRMLTPVRTKRRGLERMLKIMRERTKGPVHVIVMHANVLHEAEELKARISSEFDCAEIYVTDFTPVMGIHTGPGLVAIAFYSGV